MPATSTFDLVERIRQGDSRAFEPLFQKYARRLAIFIRYRMPPELALHSDVDDILQETFLEAYRDLGMFAYRGSQSFFAWLAGIAFGLAASAIVIAIQLKYTDNPAPYVDSSLLVWSLVAQWMTARKWIENWILWVLINTVSVPLYISRDLGYTAALYVGLWILAIFGYFQWRRTLVVASA